MIVCEWAFLYLKASCIFGFSFNTRYIKNLRNLRFVYLFHIHHSADLAFESQVRRTDQPAISFKSRALKSVNRT